jgi:hypothetical protein
MESNYDIALKMLYEKSVLKLLDSDIFDEEAFKHLKIYLEIKAKKVKRDSVISKQVLLVVTQAKKSIEIKSKTQAAVKKNLQLAKDFENLLYLIIEGINPEEHL